MSSAGTRALWCPPETTARARRGIGGGDAAWLELRRRGLCFGWVVEGRDADLPVETLWCDARPVPLRGAVAEQVTRLRAPIARSLRLFDAVRGGAGFRDAVARRLAGTRFVLAGTSVDVGDAREIEKVHADERTVSGRLVARDLWGKLSWVAHDRRDPSLRVRFSFGGERLREWAGDARRAAAADRLAEAAFPECAALAANGTVLRLLRRLAGGPVRLSERIVYSNAPGGGAVFHHDAEPGQRGVVYAQLAGETAWIAVRKRDLAAAAAQELRRPAARVLRDLDAPRDRAFERLLHASPHLVGRLVREGHFLRLRAGDALLLPSHGEHDVAWHSVFGVGRAPSLALSFAVFDLRRSRSR